MTRIKTLPPMHYASDLETVRELARAAVIIEKAARKMPSFKTNVRKDCQAALKKLGMAINDLSLDDESRGLLTKMMMERNEAQAEVKRLKRLMPTPRRS